ncbi:mycofactocin biosynthesis glycosyltransferase MftF [Nocardioides mangrovicus]|uniref:mycofactocin biosynthesis glycosyltransferase MftF n=1 Tax=Nocardioides mangrovicus TaxID=2478913 RepID=UPI0018E0A74C|nr:mycofactocin biosynthesis glycosyltransferase MftF [Nocardioides mangrovicus]
MPSLPAGFGVALSPRTKVCDDGRTLVGASGRVMYLSPRAAGLVAGLPAEVGAGRDEQLLARRLLDSGAADPWWAAPAGRDADVADVTVVVPVHERADGLRRLLAALPDPVPVVVVDDGSADAAPIAAVAAEHGARLVVHPENRGPAAARNTGLHAAGTPFVAFVDSDVEPRPGWLAVLRRHLDDPTVAIAAPRVLGPVPRADDSWVERYEQARSSLDLGEHAAAVRVHGQVAYVPSACLLVRVDALGDEGGGGFDEALRSGEDVDLVWRLLADGWGVRYEPAAQVRHRHRSQPAQWLRRKAFYGASAAPLAARHPGAVSPMVLAPWSAAMTAALLAQRRWSMPVALAAYAVATARTAQRLQRSDRPVAAAATVVLEGSVAALWQTSAALTRHYWPVAAAGCLVSRRARRAVLASAVLDGLADHRRTRPRLDPLRYVVARRLDDLAYGTGVWRGALAARSLEALRPSWVRSTR